MNATNEETTALTSNDLPQLATRINSEHRWCERNIRNGLGHAKVAGELLLKAKEQLPHGAWLPWLKDNVTFSEWTARRYMALAEGWETLTAKSGTVPDLLTINEALRLLTEPPADQEEERTEEVVDQEEECIDAALPLPDDVLLSVQEALYKHADDFCYVTRDLNELAENLSPTLFESQMNEVEKIARRISKQVKLILATASYGKTSGAAAGVETTKQPAPLAG